MILWRGNVVEMGATERVFANPLHPYTKNLLASVPQLHTKWENVQEEALPGSGGRLVQVEEGHFVASLSSNGKVS